MMNTKNETEAKALAVLLNSDTMRAALAAEDARRLEAHQAAADALLEFETDTRELETAAAAVEEARARLSPIEEKYREAAHRLLMAEGKLRDLSWSRDHDANRLRSNAARHLPPIVSEVERALYFCGHEIRNSLTVNPREERLITGGRRTVWESNRAEMDAALAQIEAMREIIGALMLDPTPSEEITETLSTEAAKLIELAKVCGAMVAHHLPEAVRPGLFVERPERKGPYAIPR